MIDDFTEILDHYDIPYKEKLLSPEIDVLCPFHDDMHFGNAKYNKNRDTFHCFSCSASGNKYQFVSQLEGCSLKEAEALLASNFKKERETYNISTLKDNLKRKTNKWLSTPVASAALLSCNDKMLQVMCEKRPPFSFLKKWFPVMLYLRGPSSEELTEKEIVNIYGEFYKQLNQELS